MTTTEDKIEWLINNLSTPDMAIVEEVIEESRKLGYDEGVKEGMRAQIVLRAGAKL